MQDFSFAEPDALAHFSSTIMERVNSGGKKIENALKALCQRAKGLDVEVSSLKVLQAIRYGLSLHTQLTSLKCDICRQTFFSKSIGYEMRLICGCAICACRRCLLLA